MIARKIDPALTILRLILLLLTAAACAGAMPNHPPEPPAGREIFLTFSDIHFAPFSDTTLAARLLAADYPEWRAIYESSPAAGVAAYGSETNYPLLRSLLENMRRTEPEPRLIILTGDLLAHDFRGTFRRFARDAGDSAYDRFVYRTLGFLATMIDSYFPRTVVLPALGNNDSYSGNYSVGPRSRFLADFGRFWGAMVKRSGDTASFTRDFPVSGCYASTVPGLSGHRVIALNTIFFSAKYCNRCDAAGSFCATCDTSAPYPGDMELAWLDAELAASERRGERVWLAYHIPPGIDSYGSIDSAGGSRTPVIPFWRDGYERRFRALMKRYAGTVRASFAGHTHMDDFRLLADSGGDPFGFVHITPAVSPIYGNNPAFQQFVVDGRSGMIEDYATHFIDLAEPGGRAWRKEYEFRSAYGASRYDLASLVRLFRAIVADPAVRERYRGYYAVSSGQGSFTAKNWHGYACGMEHLGVEEFQECCSD